MVNEAHGLSAVESARQNFAEALNRSDFAGLAAIYADDALMLPPGSETIVGRSNIQGYWGRRPAVEQVRFEPVHVKALGEEAIREAGTLKLGTRGPGRRIREVSWNYAFVWQKVGAEWKLETCIWNRQDAVQPNRANPQRGQRSQGAAQGGQGLGQGGQGRNRIGQGGGQGGQGFRQGGQQGGQGGRGGQGGMGGQQGQGGLGGQQGQGGGGRRGGGGQGRGPAPFVPRSDFE